MNRNEHAAIAAGMDGLLEQLDYAAATGLEAVVQAAHARDYDRVCVAAQEAKVVAEFQERLRVLRRDWEGRMRGR